MSTLDLVRGWEHGLETPVVNGGGLADEIVGTTITVQSAIKRTGGYALRFNKTATANCYLKKTVPTSTVRVGSIHFRFTTFPATADDEICWCNVSAGANLAIKFDTATSKLFARFQGVSDGNTADLALSLNTWYRVDYKFDVSANPSKIDFQVVEDGGSTPTAATQSTLAQAATTITTVVVGSSNTNTSDWYVDDEVYSATAADYPIGAHAVEGNRTSGDGTHNNGANVLENAAGEDIGGTVYAYQYLDENPWTSTADGDYVRQTANGTANYAEVLFADTTETTILGAMALLEYASAATSGNTGGCVIIDEDATVTTLWGVAGALADYSESSAFYKSVILPTPAGGWDAAAVNALKCRFGYSGDASPDPYWLAIMLEVAYVPVSGTPATVTAVAGTATAAMIPPALVAYASITAVAATSAAAMIAPSVIAQKNDSVTGVVATATAAGIAPVVTGAGGVTAVTATATAAGIAPAISSVANVTGTAGTASAAMIAPSLAGGVGITAVTATASAAMVTPSLSSVASIAGVTATATAAMIAPEVSTAGNGSVTAVVATAGAAGIAPVLSGVGNVTGVVATSAAAMVAPAVSGGSATYAIVTWAEFEVPSGVVTGVATTATAAMAAPALSANSAITGTAATSTALMLVPVVTSSAEVVCVVGIATAAGIAPTLSGVAQLTATVASASAAMIAPTVEGSTLGSATVVAVVMVATALMYAPGISITELYRRHKLRPAVIDYHGTHNVIDGTRRFKRGR